MTEAVEPNFDHLSRMTTSDRCRREDAFRRFHICHDKLVALSYIGSERATRRVVVLKKAFPAGRRKVFPGVIAPSPIRREIGGSSACHIEPVCQSETRLGPVLPGKGLPALLGHRITLEGDAEFLDVLYPSGNLIKNSSDHIHRYAGWMGKLPVNVTHEDEPPPSGQLS